MFETTRTPFFTLLALLAPVINCDACQTKDPVASTGDETAWRDGTVAQGSRQKPADAEVLKDGIPEELSGRPASELGDAGGTTAPSGSKSDIGPPEPPPRTPPCAMQKAEKPETPPDVGVPAMTFPKQMIARTVSTLLKWHVKLREILLSLGRASPHTRGQMVEDDAQ